MGRSTTRSISGPPGCSTTTARIPSFRIVHLLAAMM
jgi:hypothetical protein